jgi:hypothetical protein
MVARKRVKRRRRKPLATGVQVRFRAYAIINDCVNAGVRYGLVHARKHTNKPDEETVVTAVHDAVMNALSEVIAWDKEDW